MPKTFSRLPAIIMIFALIGLFVLGCTQQTETPVLEITGIPEPTNTEEFIPPVVNEDAQEIVLLSIEEDGYAHLFAYIPYKLPLTRITNGDWDDISPAPSPDGEKVAFASNRLGFWDLFLMNLSTGELTRLTNTPQYEGAPTWSPDGSFLAYESYRNENLDVIIGPSDDPINGAINLTSSTATDHSPAWAPGGRQIAFISNGEVILADLDNPDNSRFQNLSNTPYALESYPIWSPDGSHLAWASESQNIGQSGIYIWDANTQLPAHWLGDGNLPAWNASGSQIITTVPAPNTNYTAIYSIDGHLLQPLTPFPFRVDGMKWGKIVMPDPMPDEFIAAAKFTPAPLWAAQGEPVTEGGTDRYELVDLPDVQAPYPKLHDLTDEAFASLRERVQWDAGWDVLASLENAFVPITSELDPGNNEDWLYTGRAFAVNSLMTNAGWMVAVREDFGSQTYWRLYIRAQVQDGSLGMPLHDLPWDLQARYNLDPQAYEQGGTYVEAPPGYWVDVTSLAAQYSWERVPALPNWRTYIHGARFTEFALTDGLDWYTAMLQLYPPDVLVTPTRVLPPTLTPTRTPTSTPTPTNTRTPRNTRTPTITRTPTVTRTPSITPTPTLTPTTTPTPPTIIP